MTEVFLVTAENSENATFYIKGIYPTRELAVARLNAISETFDYVYIEKVMVSETGADINLVF